MTRNQTYLLIAVIALVALAAYYYVAVYLPSIEQAQWMTEQLSTQRP